jgi:hypothetical protein
MRAVLDHAVIDVRDALDDAAAACERLGFQLTPPSENTLGSINRLCVFGNTYLELLGIGPRAEGVQRERMANPVGANGLVFRSDDAAETAGALRERNVRTGDVRAFSRPVDVDGASLEARFETVHVQLADLAPLRAYFCRHWTPELIWRRGWSDHPNGALDIVGITIVARDPKMLGAWFARAFDGVEERSDHWLVDAEHGWIDIRSADAFEDNFGLNLVPDTRTASIHALTVATTDVAAAKDVIGESGLATAAAGSRLIVLPQPAINVAIEFV